MSALQRDVAAVFSTTGPLAQTDPTYQVRPAQVAMACAVAAAIEAREVLVTEAGTGVGKTFAYLVPVLASGARALISTATKSLQDQLFLRDLPRLSAALGMPVSAAMLKGRSSYLCTHRLQSARHTDAVDPWSLRTLSKVERWAQVTRTGDLAELEGLDERSSVLPLVTSTRENCLGTDCEHFKGCHVFRARREAMAADIVVINHHLFFADLNLRDSGVAELLPSVEVAIFDEAHQLTEAGIQFLGDNLGSAQLVDFNRDVLRLGLGQAKGLRAWTDLVAACERAIQHWRLGCAGGVGSVRQSVKLRWHERADDEAFRQGLQQLMAALQALVDALTHVAAVSGDMLKLLERGEALMERAQAFSQPASFDVVRWIELTPLHARLVESPLDIREALRAQIDTAGKGWVFTSATLGDDEALSWFTQATGLEDAVTLRADSPFDYAAQARLFIPSAFPQPNEPGHAEAVAALAARCARTLGGRTFVLTTTLRALRTIGPALQAELERSGESFQVLQQGDMPKRQLIDQFLASSRGVLVGSQSFWEGIDVPGDALQCVVIDKLPFPPPTDPLVEARVRRLQDQGRNAFADFFVAEAAISLKQGAGRLIRSETDRGLLVVCDPRMAKMGYGKRLKAALPPMTLLTTEAQAIAWLKELTDS
ncbi:MAG: ATP-dependent DNA helicase, partial [Pseudomonadota bacterium]